MSINRYFEEQRKYDNQEFSNTDAELARCIKSRMRHELNTLHQGNVPLAKNVVRDFLLELCAEIINEDF